MSNEEEMQIIEEEDSLDFDSSRRSKNDPFSHSASLNQPTPPHINQSPLQVGHHKEQHSDLIIPPSKQSYNSRNAFVDSLTDPGLEYNNRLMSSNHEDDSRKVKA